MKQKNRINELNTETNNNELTPRRVASRLAELVVLFAERDLDWLAERGLEIEITVYDGATCEGQAITTINARSRVVSERDHR